MGLSVAFVGFVLVMIGLMRQGRAIGVRMGGKAELKAKADYARKVRETDGSFAQTLSEAEFVQDYIKKKSPGALTSTIFVTAGFGLMLTGCVL